MGPSLRCFSARRVKPRVVDGEGVDPFARGRLDDEAVLLDAGLAFERETPWHQKRPPLLFVTLGPRSLKGRLGTGKVRRRPEEVLFRRPISVERTRSPLPKESEEWP